MIIGSVKEIKLHEYRVGLTPDNARNYVAHNHTVYVEKGLGEGSAFSDEEYRAAGATVLDSAAEVWALADMIVKVKEPLKEEFDLMRPGQIIYTYFHMAAAPALADALLKARVKAVAYETVTDRNGLLPLLKPMSEIAGRMSIQEGAKYLEKPFGGRGVLLSGVPGVPKGKVVILGAGVVGLNACKTAVGSGADVTVLDINLDRLAHFDDLFGARIQTIFSTEGTIQQALAEADLVIGAVLIPGASAPKLVKKEYLPMMKPGSVIVDVAVDQGGCCETSRITYHDQPIYIEQGIVHYCVGNMPAAVPRTSTVALTNATLKYGLAIANQGLEAAGKADKGILAGINTYDGRCTCKNVAKSLGLEYTDIETVI